MSQQTSQQPAPQQPMQPIQAPQQPAPQQPMQPIQAPQQPMQQPAQQIIEQQQAQIAALMAQNESLNAQVVRFVQNGAQFQQVQQQPQMQQAQPQPQMQQVSQSQYVQQAQQQAQFAPYYEQYTPPMSLTRNLDADVSLESLAKEIGKKPENE